MPKILQKHKKGTKNYYHKTANSPYLTVAPRAGRKLKPCGKGKVGIRYTDNRTGAARKRCVPKDERGDYRRFSRRHKPRRASDPTLGMIRGNFKGGYGIKRTRRHPLYKKRSLTSKQGNAFTDWNNVARMQGYMRPGSSKLDGTYKPMPTKGTAAYMRLRRAYEDQKAGSQKYLSGNSYKPATKAPASGGGGSSSKNVYASIKKGLAGVKVGDTFWTANGKYQKGSKGTYKKVSS